LGRNKFYLVRKGFQAAKIPRNITFDLTTHCDRVRAHIVSTFISPQHLTVLHHSTLTLYVARRTTHGTKTMKITDVSEDSSGFIVQMGTISSKKNSINLIINTHIDIQKVTFNRRRSQWPCRLRRRVSAALLLRLWVRIPSESWMFVCCECCVLSGRGLCGELITRPEESYRVWRVVVCDLETSKTRRLKLATGL
jgi:hypothetical protein